MVVIVIIGQFERPDWCLKLVSDKHKGDESLKDFDEYYCNTPDGIYTSSNLIKLSPAITLPTQVLALAIIIWFSHMSNMYRDMDAGARRSQNLMYVFFAITILNILWVVFTGEESFHFPWVAAILRPFFLIASIRSIRSNLKSYLLVIKDTMAMVLFIGTFILYYSWMGQRLFSGTLEGIEYFDTYSNSAFNMLVLMTTSNYPDVMLPAYQRNRLNCIFFISYLVLGLFLMMSLLLAVFYSNFKERFQERIDRSEDRRSKYLYELFDELSDGKDYLDKVKTYTYFVMIHRLATSNDKEVCLQMAENEARRASLS